MRKSPMTLDQQHRNDSLRDSSLFADALDVRIRMVERGIRGAQIAAALAVSDSAVSHALAGRRRKLLSKIAEYVIEYDRARSEGG